MGMELDDTERFFLEQLRKGRILLDDGVCARLLTQKHGAPVILERSSFQKLLEHAFIVKVRRVERKRYYSITKMGVAALGQTT